MTGWLRQDRRRLQSREPYRHPSPVPHPGGRTDETQWAISASWFRTMRAFLLLALLAPALQAQDRTTTAPIDGRAGPFRYSYHFDHNALRDCLRIGDVLVALTDSGNLLRFDAGTLKMTGQEVVRGRGTAIAVGANGSVLVGTLAGRVWKVDPATLAAEPLFETPGKVVWLSSRSGMIVAAVYGDVEPWPLSVRTGDSG